MTPADLLASQALADEFSRLRRDLEALAVAPRHLAIIGTSGGEGVSTVASQLALAIGLGQPAGSVLLVEANLRRGTAGSVVDPMISNAPGLWQWDMTEPLPVQPFEPSVHLLGAGKPSGDKSSRAPVQDRLLAALARARADYRWSVWDLPPVLDNGYVLDLAAASDGALVVIEMDETRIGALQYLRQALERRHATVLGSVLNRCGRYWPRQERRV